MSRLRSTEVSDHLPPLSAGDFLDQFEALEWAVVLFVKQLMLLLGKLLYASIEQLI